MSPTAAGEGDAAPVSANLRAARRRFGPFLGPFQATKREARSDNGSNNIKYKTGSEESGNKNQ